MTKMYEILYDLKSSGSLNTKLDISLGCAGVQQLLCFYFYNLYNVKYSCTQEIQEILYKNQPKLIIKNLLNNHICNKT